MKTRTLSKWTTTLLVAGIVFTSFQASPEDIDIFSVDDGNTVNAPNVLIVLDNSANWSRESQQWPGNEVQGQSEADAIRTVINELGPGINVGLMEYITGGSSGDTDFAMIRSHIRPMTADNKATLADRLTTIYNNINTADEKRSQSNPFGNLFWDIYNYLGGFNTANGGAGTLAAKAAAAGYEIPYSKFRSPLTSADTCTRTIVIFIGNNVQNGPTPDSQQNIDALHALAGGGVTGDRAVAQIPFAEYVVQSSLASYARGYTPACYSSAAACTTAVNNAECAAEGFNSCSCDAGDSVACPNYHWRVVGTNTTTNITVLAGPTTTSSPNTPTGDIIQTCKTDGQAGNLNAFCPAASDVTQTDTPSVGQSTRTQTSWADCAYAIKDNTGCGINKNNYELRGTRTRTVTVTQANTTTSQDSLGETTACYSSQPACNPADGAWSCAGYNGGCACVSAGDTTGCGAASTSKFQVVGQYTTSSAVPTGTFGPAPAGPFMMDEWARFLRSTGVPVPGSDVRSQVTTYTIDVFNAQQHKDFSGLLFNAARVGGGKYFQARDKSALLRALREIFTEVQAVNSAFSSASLPINATNRTQNENQVFIGVFKPSRTKDPQWFGNLKRYQIISNNGEIDLGDSLGNSAINKQTGFLADCAVSYWTTDSGTYWDSVITDDPDALGICQTNTTSDWSDSPDGPFVEKGAVAEVIRKGNNPASAPDGSGNYVLNRNVYTLSGTSMVPLTASTFDDLDVDGVTDEAAEQVIVDFFRGQDVDDNDLDTFRAEPRSTIHGDVVHSRPQPVSYGGTTGVVIYYGGNDGHFRAVKANTGEELWSFIAPEHHPKVPRLRFSGTSGKKVKFFGDTAITLAPKDYFFDGSTGTYQVFNDSNAISTAWIFPTMRRGGRKIYSFDVTNPNSPTFKWSRGCPNLTNDTGCDAGFAAMAQTWSNASVAFIKGFSETTPVIITGGGYDRCDDEDTATPCAASKGRGVYVINANTGALVRYFDFSTLAGFSARGVAADIALISINPDKFVDYAYAADTGGNIYRLDFIDGPASQGSLAAADWSFSRVAHTNGAGRKFLFSPSLLQASPTTIYLALGSGDREHPLMRQYPFGTEGMPSTAVLNRFYVFKDDIADIDATTATDLDDGSADGDMANYSGNPGCDSPPIQPGSTKAGWFKNLNDYGQGEQVVSAAVIAGGFVNFSTNRPTPPDAESCSNSLGEARGYFVNLLNGSGGIGVDGSCGGSQSSTFIGGGLPPSPVIATVQIGDRVETIVIGAVSKEGGPGSAIAPTLRNPNLDNRRRPVYWYKTSGDN